MPRSLTPETIATVTATIPALEAHGETITRTMYASLLADPAIAAMFNPTDQANGRQPHALATAVLAFARHIAHPERLEGALGLIVEKHVALSVLPEQYPVVGTALLGAIKTVLGDAATPAILDAWAEAYGFLADVLIEREQTVYKARETAPGGWRGWRTFRVTSRVQESPDVASFRLEPTDGRPVLRHEPGQYLTFRIRQDDLDTRRCYSISCAPDDIGYRISIKHVPGGQISHWFHQDVQPGTLLDIAPPAGNFTPDRTDQHPVVLVGAGIGLTPLLSMASDHIRTRQDIPLHIHYAIHEIANAAFLDELAALASQNPHVSITLSSSTDTGRPACGPLNVQAGHLTAEALVHTLPAGSHIYICGPRSFQRDLIGGLTRLKVDPSRLHHEFFGPDEAVHAA